MKTDLKINRDKWIDTHFILNKYWHFNTQKCLPNFLLPLVRDYKIYSFQLDDLEMHTALKKKSSPFVNTRGSYDIWKDKSNRGRKTTK